MSGTGDILTAVAPSITPGLSLQKVKLSNGKEFIGKNTQISWNEKGIKTNSLHQSQGSPATLFGTGLTLQTFNLLPDSIIPDVISEMVLEVTVSNPNGTGNVIFACYAASMIQLYNCRYSNTVQTTHYSECTVVNSLTNYSNETMQIRGPQENINPTTYAPNTVTLTPGQSQVFYIPVLSPFGNNNVWIRSLSAELILQIYWNSLSNLFTFTGGATLVAASAQIRCLGYTFDESVKRYITQAFDFGVVTRYIALQQTEQAVSGGITAGTQITTPISNNESLCLAIQFYFRAPLTGVYTSAVVPIANSVYLVTLLSGSQPLSTSYPNSLSQFYRNVWTAPPYVNSPGAATVALNWYPFTKTLSQDMMDGTSRGVFWINTSSQIQITSQATQNPVNLVCQYARVCLLNQAGANLTIQEL